MTETIGMEARAFSTSEAAKYTSFSESWLRKARIGLTDTPGPRFRKIGKRVLYLREDLDAFLEQPSDDSQAA